MENLDTIMDIIFVKLFVRVLKDGKFWYFWKMWEFKIAVCWSSTDTILLSFYFSYIFFMSIIDGNLDVAKSSIERGVEFVMQLIFVCSFCECFVSIKDENSDVFVINFFKLYG